MRSNYTVVSRAELSESVWNDFVEAADEAWFWHRPEFIEARSLYPGSSDVSFGVQDKSGRLVAVMPLYEIVGNRYSRAADVTRWLYSEGGPAISYPRGSSAHKRLSEALKEHLLSLMGKVHARHVEVRVATLAPFLHRTGAPRANPLYELGFENTSGATWLIDLRAPLDEIRRRYSETTRQLVKQARERQFKIREAAGEHDLNLYYELHLETVRRLETEPEPFNFFEKIFMRIQPTGRIRILFLERDGVIIAANTSIFDKKAAYYWTSASRTTKIGYESRVLMDEQIAYAHKLGCICFEAGKAYVPGDNAALVRGTSTFKQSFGSELVTSYSGRICAPPPPPAPNQFLLFLSRIAGQ